MERMCIQWLIEAHRMAVQGNRDNIDSMAGGSQKILNQVLKLIDQHDLYGSVAYPKKHQQKDISDIYRLPYATRGIFTNVALQEPFGLTVIEVGGPMLICLPQISYLSEQTMGTDLHISTVCGLSHREHETSA